MKQMKQFFVLFAIVAMTLSSCTKYAEEDLIPQVVIGGGATVTQFDAGMSADQSRAGVNSDHHSIWHAGDNMTIVKFNPGQTTPQVLHAAALNSTISSDGRTMTFATDLPIHADGEQYAIYPAQTNKDVKNYTSGKIGNRTFSIELPEQEIGTDGSFRYPALLGHWDAPTVEGERGSFLFSNPFTILHFTLKKPADETEDLVLTHIQIKGNNDELMWGAAEATIIDNGNGTFEKSIKMVQGAEKHVNLDTRIDGVGQTITTEGKEFYVCIPAQNYSKGMTINFFCEGDESASIWYMETPLMTRNGVDCSSKKNTMVNLPALELNVEKSSIFTSLVRATASTLAVSWTTSIANTPYLSQQAPSTKANYTAENANNTYIIELWTNDACEYGTGSLVQSWIIKGNEYYYENAGDESEKETLFTKNYAPSRFVFGYLNPATTYYFRVKYSTAATPDVNDESQWHVLEYPREVRTEDPFSSGVETVLYEDFRDCVMGGDFSTRSAGYISYDRSSMSGILDAVINLYDSSDSETATDINHRLKLPNLEGFGNKGVGSPWAVCPQEKETALFSTMRNLVADTTGECPGNYKTYKGYTSKLKDWAWFSDDDTPGTVLMRAGYLKVGAMYKHTGIVTPKLSMLSGASTVTVEFYACPYGASTLDKGELPIAVKVLDGVSVYADTSTTVAERTEVKDQLNRIDISTIDAATSDIREITLEGNQYSWKKYKVTFTGVLPTSRIAFCSNRAEENTNNRFLIDDVHIYLEQSEPLTVKQVTSTDSTITIGWTSTASNIPNMTTIAPASVNYTSEITDTYAVAIYDANKTLMGKMSGIIKDDKSAALFTAVQKPLRWIFTGLEPSTKYYVKVWNTTDGTESGYLEVSTTASLFEKDDVVSLDQTAVPGHMLLFENFAGCLYGGCHSTRAAGYKHKSYVANGTNLIKAGAQTHNTSAYFCVGCAANVTLFTTAKNQINNTLGLTDWSWVYNDNATATTGIMIRPGYVQIGISSANNMLATPSLTNMPDGVSSLRVTFRACPYGSASGSLSDAEALEKSIAVRVLTGGSVGSDYQLTGYTVVDEQKLTLTGNNNTVWKEYTVDLHNVPSGARIAFGGGRTDYAENRWHLDDVRIQLVNNSDLLVGVVRATDTTLNIGWTETAANADKFLTHQPATATKSGSTVTTTYKFDYNTSDNMNAYTVYLYTDEACTNLYQSWVGDKSYWHDGASTTDGVTTYTNFYPTRFIFTGLEPETDYYVVVRNNSTGKQSSAVKVSTVAKQYQGKGVVTVGKNLMPGNTIIFNNFGKIYYGGDGAGFAMGYSINSSVAASQTENFNAQGHLPYSNDTRVDFDRRRCDTEHGLFSTYAGMLDDYDMSDWSYMSDDSQVRVLIKPGYLKIGNGSSRAHIVTPLLSAIPEGEVWSVKVRFKACPFTQTNYVHDTAEDDIIVAAYEGGDVGATVDGVEYPYCFVNGSIVDSQELNLGSHVGAWKQYEVTLNNVTCDCRIGIGGARSTKGQNRFYVDDIEVQAANASDVKYLTGYVWESNGTTPVEGVMVTDGYHVAKTNAKGKYRMLYEPSVYKPEYVYYTTPAGYEIGRAGTGLPVTYYKVGDALLNPAEGDYAKDFKLGPKMTASTHANYNASTGKQDKWFLFVMADPQTHEASGGEHNDGCFARFRDYVAPDIKARVSGFNSAIAASDGGAQGYGVVLGDVTWNAPAAHHATMKSAMEVGDTGIYWFPAPGNHDWYQGDSDESPTISHFKNVYGPTRISFDRGDIHVVVMNNVIVKDGSTSLGVSKYQAGFTDEEWTWLQNDLSHVDKSKGVVLCVHIPFRNGVASGEKSGANVMKDRYYDAVLTELAKFQHAYIFSGHTHKQEMYVHTGYPTAGGDYVTEVVHAAACGVFWNASICAEGTPAGYAVYTFEGNRAKHQRFKAVGNTKALDNVRNNVRMYSAYERVNGSVVTQYYYNRGDTSKKGRIIANVFMSHQDGGAAGELSGNWVVQLYDSALKKWVNMTLMDKTNNTRSVPATFPSITADTFIYTNANGNKVLRNDADWWWWSNVVEANSYITNRNGNNWGGAASSDGYQSLCRHLWYGDLSYQLTDAQIAGTASHTVKVRAIPPHYNNNATVQAAITNGTDLDGYSLIYICNELTHYGKSQSDYYGLDWTTVTGSSTIYKE